MTISHIQSWKLTIENDKKNDNFQVHFWVALKLSEILRCSTSCIAFKEKKIEMVIFHLQSKKLIGKRKNF